MKSTPKLFATALFLLTWPCFINCAALDVSVSNDKNSANLPVAENVLKKVRNRMPVETLLINGRLLCGKRLGTLEKLYYVDTFLELGKDPLSAQYTIMDVFGTPVEQLTITRKLDGKPTFYYKKGDPLKPARAPDIHSFIKNTDITWNDLSLSFLWDQNGITTGRENRLGRDCIIIEFTTPADQINNTESARSKTTVGLKKQSNNPSTTRLWIDERLSLLIQMEEYDALGNRLRRLSVKKIKKISDMWMIKDMAIRRYPSKHKTILRVDNISRERESDSIVVSGK